MVCVYVCVCINIASSPLSRLHWQVEVQCSPGVTTGFVAEHLEPVQDGVQHEKKGDMMECLGHVLPMAVVHSIFEVT